MHKTINLFTVLFIFSLLLTSCVWLTSDYGDDQDLDVQDDFTLDQSILEQKISEYYKIYETKDFFKLETPSNGTLRLKYCPAFPPQY